MRIYVADSHQWHLYAVNNKFYQLVSLHQRTI